MFKKLFVGALWFVSASLMYSLVAYVIGLPAGGGVIVGALAAAFVVMDPAGVLWSRETAAPVADSPQGSQQTV